MVGRTKRVVRPYLAILLLSLLVSACGGDPGSPAYPCVGCWLGRFSGNLYQGTNSTDRLFQFQTGGSSHKVVASYVDIDVYVPRLSDCALDLGIGVVGPAIVGIDGAFAFSETTPYGRGAETVGAVLVNGVLGCDGSAHGTILVERNNGCGDETFTWEASVNRAAAPECTA